MNVTWVIDSCMLVDTRYSHLPDVVSAQGMTAHVIQYIPFLHEYELPFDEKTCSVFYGSVNMARALKGKCFGMYARENELLYHRYTAELKLPMDLYLNGDAVATTFYDFRTNPTKFYNLFRDDVLFIRPNSGLKTFAGFCIDIPNFYSEINGLQHLSGVMDDTIIWVAKPKKIINEYRFIICNREIIDGSRYRTKDGHYEDREIEAGAYPLVQMVADAEWRPDSIFTCDIASTPAGFKIIELNSFSCAGMYACDPATVVKAVSEQAWREFNNLDME